MADEAQKWVWITKPDSYLNDAGEDNEYLDPASGLGSDGGWWTCHPDTQVGDLVLLYRTAPRSDIAYLLEAASPARRLGSIPDDRVVTLEVFENLLGEALTKEAVAGGSMLREANEDFEDAKARSMAVQEALRRYGWESDDLEQARIDHERLELELGRREREDGLDSVQAEWDRWSEQDDALELVEGWFVDLWGNQLDPADRIEEARENLGWLVFEALDMPEDTILETQTEFRGRWVCAWEPRFKFTKSMPLDTFRADGWLMKNWNALRANFKGSFFVFDADVWERVIGLAASNGNPDLPGIVAQYSAPGPSPDIVSEHQIRDALAANPKALGLGDLALYDDPTQPGVSGKEFRCGDVGYADLLLTDSQGIPTVVELKTKRAGEAVIGQIGKYLGWVKKNLPGGDRVSGVVVSDGYNAKYEAAASVVPGLTHIEVSEVRDRLGL